jgi:hypothetical protein
MKTFICTQCKQYGPFESCTITMADEAPDPTLCPSDNHLDPDWDEIVTKRNVMKNFLTNQLEKPDETKP